MGQEHLGPLRTKTPDSGRLFPLPPLEFGFFQIPDSTDVSLRKRKQWSDWVIYACGLIQYLPLFSQSGGLKTCGEGALSVQRLAQEIGNRRHGDRPTPSSDSCLNKPNTPPTFAPCICSRPYAPTAPSPTSAGTGLTGSLKVSTQSTSWGRGSLDVSQSCDCFFPPPEQSEFLMFSSPLLLECLLHYIHQCRDRTFGEIILSSSLTCDHNLKSRNLLSSCREEQRAWGRGGSGG